MFKEGPGVRMNLQMKMHKNYRLRKEDGLRGKHLKKRKIRCAFIFYINLKRVAITVTFESFNEASLTYYKRHILK